jgi:tetratricopeptide (TPR) repeat protein
MPTRGYGLKRLVRDFWLSLKEYFRQRLETRDQLVRRHFQAGVKAIHDSRWLDAEEAFSRVLSRKSDHFLAHLYLGVSIYHQGRHEEARSALVRAKRIDPKRFAAYQASKALPDSDRGGRPQGDVLKELVKNLEECALNLRQTADKIHDASKRQQQVIRRLHSAEPRRGSGGGGRRRRGRVRKPKVNTFSSPEEAKKFRQMSPITKDDLSEVDWDEVLARILE